MTTMKAMKAPNHALIVEEADADAAVKAVLTPILILLRKHQLMLQRQPLKQQLMIRRTRQESALITNALVHHVDQGVAAEDAVKLAMKRMAIKKLPALM